MKILPTFEKISRRCLAAFLPLFAVGSVGLHTPPLHAATPSTEGEWATVQSLPWRPVHSIMLPTGKVMVYANNDQRQWNSVTEILEDTTDAGYNMFCNSHILLGDGRVFFAGGHISGCNGLPNSSYYNPVTDTFTHMPNMNGGRWYPTQVTLPNGDTVIMSGKLEDGSKNLIPQVFEVSSNDWRTLSSASLNLPLFPAAFLAPNGKVFVATSPSRYLDTAGSGNWADVATRNVGGRDNYGSACMYEPGKVIYTGGADAPVSSCEVIDLNATTPTWTFVSPMPQVRRQQNVTILPDGRVLVTGGSSSAGFNTEDGPKSAIVWDPDTDTWTTWATETEYRGYHSEAVLLPDARVVSIGGDGHPSLQVFSPPYLFNGARPSITTVQTTAELGETFPVTTPDGADISQVNWVRPSAVTHTKNMNQRINKLSFTQIAGGLNVTAPTSASDCPPGDYMLFLINSNGVPSVAAWVTVTEATATQPPPAPANLAATAGDAQVSLTWNAAPDATRYNVKRATVSAGPYTTVATGVVSTSFNDTGLSNGTTYYYVVSAENSVGESPDSNEANATPMLQPPGTPTSLEAIGLDARVDLVWSAPSGTVDSYSVKRATGSGGPYTTIATGVASTSYSDNTAVNGTTYYYVVSAVNGAGESTNSNEASAAPNPPPAPPTNLAATPGNAKVTLTWTASPFANEYNLYRSTTPGGPYSVVAFNIDLTIFTDTGLNNGTTYYYVVTGVNPAGESANSNEASGTPANVGIQLTTGTLTGVGSAWQVVNLGKSYASMVVAASAAYGAGQGPAVARVRNAVGSSFEIKVQQPGGGALSGFTVHYLVVEEGVYTAGIDGVTMEAVKANSTVTARKGAWTTEARVYQNAYTSPVVVGQVMTENDTNWSSFWASNGTQGAPPSVTVLSAGKHVGEDTLQTRADETIGYIVIEAGSGTIEGTPFVAAVGADTVEGFTSGAAPFNYTLSGLSNPQQALVSSSGMDGGDGGWPILYGPSPLTTTTLALVIDEDTVGDTERGHTTEQVAYIVFDEGNSPPNISSHTASANPGPVNTSITFTLNATDPDTDPLTYSFDFGDGTPQTPFVSANNASHTYTAPGRYTVTGFVTDGTFTESNSLVQIVHLPLTAGTPTASSQIIHDDSRGKVWNVNPDSDTVTRIDVADLSKNFEVGVGTEPRSLALRPDNSEVWVVSEGSDQIHVLDAGTGGVLATLPTPRGSRPMGIAFAPDGSAAYVTYMDSGLLAEWNPATRTETATLAVGKSPRAVAISGDSGRIFVGRFISPVDPFTPTNEVGEVREVSAASFTVTRTFALAHDLTPDTESSGRGTPNYLVQMAISPDGERLWTPSKKDNVDRGTFRDGLALAQDATVRSIFSKLDLVNNIEDTAGRKDVDDHELPHGVAFSPVGDLAFIAYQGNNRVKVFNSYDNSLVANIDLGSELAPQDLVVTPDGARLFVLNFMTRSVSAFDIAGLVNGTAPSATSLAVVDAVNTELLAANVLLGKQIFYNAADTRMTAQGYISCATCHLDGGSDERVWDFTDRGEGFRNTITLRGRAGTGHGNVHWTANFDEIQDFENDIRNAFGGAGFMSDTDFNTGTRSNPLGDPKAGVSADLDALAAYVSSLSGVSKSPYRNADGTLTADGAAGRTIFQDLNCAQCHAGQEFSDSIVSSSSFNLHDVGSIKTSSGNRIGATLTGLDTPTLRGLWNTGPYLHDGSAATLLDVLTTQNPSDQHGATSTLTSTERNQLVAYLQQIDDNEPAAVTAVKLAQGVLTGVSSSWQTVNLSNVYNSMVVVAAANYGSGDSPAVVRIRNATGSSFDVKVQNPSDTALNGYTVHYLAVEEGVYTAGAHGVTMEAVKFTSTITDENNSWVAETRTYQNSYTSPVVLGQVMTANDPKWSVFWANGGAQGQPPSATTLRAGKHVAEDSTVARANETLGYMVIEAGSGSIGAVNYTAAQGPDTIEGAGNAPPYPYTISGIAGAQTAVVSATGMDGGNGGWPVLWGASPVSATTLNLAFDEDQILDTERAHITEQAAYIVFE